VGDDGLLVMPEGRKIRSDSDYIFRLSGISRIKRTAAALPPLRATTRSPESLIGTAMLRTKDSGFRLSPEWRRFAPAIHRHAATVRFLSRHPRSPLFKPRACFWAGVSWLPATLRIWREMPD